MSASSVARAGEVDRTSPLPFHHQLLVILRSLIEDGALLPGEALPGELRLCERYGVSRTVVRQTMAALERAGLVDRVKGRGTFVSQPRPAQGLVQSLTGQFEDMAALGLPLVSRVRRLELVAAPGPVAQALEVAQGADVVLLERLRSVDDEPWVLAETYLRPEMMASLRTADLEHGSLYALMASMGVRPASGTRVVQARRAGRTVASALGVAPSAPVMLLTSVGRDRDGRAVEYFEAHHRGDRSRFEVHLVRGDGPAAPLLTLR